MKSKTKNLKWIPSILVALVIVMGACMKLAGTSQLVEIYSRIGLLPYMKILGMTEIVLTILFLYHRTMKIGLLLSTGFFGGAMAVEFSHGAVFFFPAAILSIVWIGAYLRHPSLFVSGQSKSPSIEQVESIVLK